MTRRPKRRKWPIDPKYDPAWKPRGKKHSRARGFETEAQAIEGNENRIRALGERHPLARRLAACSEEEPCSSAACQICCREFRRELTCKLARLSEGYDHCTKIDLISPLDEVEPGQLQVRHFKRLKDRLWQQLGRPGLEDAVFVLGVDISSNWPGKGFLPHWQIHAGGVAFGATAEAIWEALGPLYKTGPTIYRPLEAKDVEMVRYEDYVGAFTYTLKAIFERKIGISGRFPQKRKGKFIPLGDREDRELLPVLDKVGFGGRLIRRNAGRW